MSRHTFDFERARVKDTFPVQPPVVLADDWHDWDASFDRHVECALFEGQHVGILPHGPCAFWKHPQGRVTGLECLAGCVEGPYRLRVVSSVHKHSSGQTHKLTEKRHPLQFFLGHNRGTFGKNSEGTER